MVMEGIAVGRTGQPVTLAPVRILRPGDPGFPAEAGHYEPREDNVAERETKPCSFDRCQKPRVPGRGRRYCPEHEDPKARLPSSPPAKPTGTGKGGDLYQQLSERRQQMLDDVAAIDRVLAIL